MSRIGGRRLPRLVEQIMPAIGLHGRLIDLLMNGSKFGNLRVLAGGILEQVVGRCEAHVPGLHKVTTQRIEPGPCSAETIGQRRTDQRLEHISRGVSDSRLQGRGTANCPPVVRSTTEKCQQRRIIASKHVTGILHHLTGLHKAWHYGPTMPSQCDDSSQTRDRPRHSRTLIPILPVKLRQRLPQSIGPVRVLTLPFRSHFTLNHSEHAFIRLCALNWPIMKVDYPSTCRHIGASVDVFSSQIWEQNLPVSTIFRE